MSSRLDFLASLGLTEDDVGEPSSLPPERDAAQGGGGASGQRRVPQKLPPTSPPAGVSAAAVPVAAGRSAATNSSDLWDRIAASDNVATKGKVKNAAFPQDAETEYVPLTAAHISTHSSPLGSSTGNSTAAHGMNHMDLDGSPPHPGLPSYGRRSPAIQPSGAAHPTTSPLGAGQRVPPAYNSLGSGSSMGYEGASSTSSLGSAGQGPKPKAGRRAEPPVDPALQEEIDRAFANADAGAQELKDLGNKCFQARNFNPAIRLYTAAIEKKPTDHVLYSNRSAAYLQSPMVSGPVMALQDAEKCVELKPDWFKGWSRTGDALFKQKKHERAVECYRKSLELDSTNENTKSSLRQCEEEVGGQRAQKEFYQSQAQSSISSSDTRRGSTTWDDIQDAAAAGRSFKELELMRFRDRCESRPTSRADASKPNETPHVPVCGTDLAQSYKNGLMESFRQKKRT